MVDLCYMDSEANEDKRTGFRDYGLFSPLRTGFATLKRFLCPLRSISYSFHGGRLIPFPTIDLGDRGKKAKLYATWWLHDGCIPV